MIFRVLHHNQCFDGACSAAVFTKLHRECIDSSAEYEYVGLAHKGGGAGVDEAVFGPGENAIVDFKYSRSPKLTYWFDHHQSAFMTPDDRAHFEAGAGGGLRGCGSSLIRTMCLVRALSPISGREKFGLDTSGLKETALLGGYCGRGAVRERQVGRGDEGAGAQDCDGD